MTSRDATMLQRLEWTIKRHQAVRGPMIAFITSAYDYQCDGSLKNLKEMRADVLPLQWCSPITLVDLLQPDANYFVATLVRIERLFNTRLQIGYREPDRGFNVNEVGRLEGLQQRFRRLKVSASLGLPGNMSGRKSMDPDTYSYELERTETARMELDNTEILDEMAAYFHEKMHENRDIPVFVIPVEEGYLSPVGLTRFIENMGAFNSGRVLFLIPCTNTVLDLLLKSLPVMQRYTRLEV